MGVDTGQGHLGVADPRDHQVEEQQQGLVVGEDLALVVDQGEVLPAGVDDRAQVGPRGPDQARHVLGGGPGVTGHDRRGGGVGVHHQHLGAQLGEHVGHHEAGGPEGVVEHHLEPGPGDGVDVDGVAQGGGVELEGPGRVADVADLRRQGPSELLTVVEPLDLALSGLGDVDAVLVEEPDHHRLGVLLEEPDGDAAQAPPRADLEAGDRAPWPPRGPPR